MKLLGSNLPQQPFGDIQRAIAIEVSHYQLLILIDSATYDHHVGLGKRAELRCIGKLIRANE